MNPPLTPVALQAESPWKARRPFYTAALALVAAGLLVGGSADPAEWGFLLWSTFTGIFLTYRFNDHIDHAPKGGLRLRAFFSEPLHLLVAAQFLLVLVPLAFWHMSPFRFWVLGLTGAAGFVYSMNLPIAGRRLRPKNLLGVKNAMIGVAWGALVLVGAGGLDGDAPLALFAFASLQVAVGSALRDVSDRAQDDLDGVRTLPVVLGVPRTLAVLHGLNALSVLLLPLLGGSWTVALVVGLWRAGLLVGAAKAQDIGPFTQRWNLFACVVLLAAQALATLAGGAL